MKSQKLKIGIFDSGLGGLTVVKSLLEIVYNSEIFYVADTQHAPYGEKTSEEILDYSLRITQYLMKTYDIDMLIVACNTATSAAIQTLRESYPSLLIIGTEPGLKPAIAETKTGHIGILATPATLNGDKYQALANRLSTEKDIVLFEQACPGLVEEIEKGNRQSHEIKRLLENWVLPMKNSGVDTIVLGCTHYPLVSETITDIMQNNVKLIDTGVAIAKRVLTLADGLGHTNKGETQLHIESTATLQASVLKSILLHTYEIRSIKI